MKKATRPVERTVAIINSLSKRVERANLARIKRENEEYRNSWRAVADESARRTRALLAELRAAREERS